ncbi:YqgE/AlgH family protein [Sphingomonas nostoxanthinifaciens]|uniref:YqgE/AlgH family protein n=1 Tax=Sphingomonas nostoxanthinifaciens TaxID=2872652 RepID=UPI001CC1F7A0|nr:YqgE/AlgH family protein [Sphingomonas nostoxanthinifaciens]UAK23548.1 YqgE/AlgH family protein [Sphingomonas nostoxanthinifaciens]
MTDSGSLSLAGQLLLALPGIGDPRFAQAVIALCIHSPDGAMGIGIGRIVPQLGLHTLLGQLDIEIGEAPDAPIYHGGPVEPQRGFVLHSVEWQGEDTLVVSSDLAVTTTLDVLRAIADGVGPDRWLVALGYAGWGDGQLDEELGRHGWFTVAARDELLFETPVYERWPRSFAAAGIDVRLLAPTSGHA